MKPNPLEQTPMMLVGDNFAMVPPGRLAALEQAERDLQTLRTGCAAALIDWQMQHLVDESAPEPRRDGQHFLRGCVAVYDRVIPLLQKVLDGTVTDDDFDEAEYSAMLSSKDTSFEALKAAHDRENERLKAMWRQGVAALPERGPKIRT